MNGPIASKYPATIVYMPLIINANIRTDMTSKKYKGSYGYDASNIWFGKEKRTLEYEIFLKSASSLEVKRDPNRKPFTIQGTGKQVRDVLYNEDIVNLYFSAKDCKDGKYSI